MRSKVLVCAGVMAWSAVAVGDPLDKPPFSATPAELLAAAKQAPASSAGDDVTILRIDDEFRFDDHARVTETWRIVALIRTKAGGDNWESLGYEYRPSYQDRPQVRARVIDSGGNVAELDPKLAHEEPIAKNADRMDGTAPLPRLVVGSVLEEQVALPSREAMSSAGSSDRLQIMQSLSTRVAVVAPVALKVRVALHGFAAKPVHTTSGNLETWRYVLGPSKSPVREANVPADIDDSPHVATSSIGSWGALAKALGARVDAQIAAGPITLPAEIPHAATVANARAILTWLQTRVEPDPVSVSDAAIIPKSPAEALKLGRTDDLSLAVAYVALLRQIGITADVALIDVGPGSDVAADMPELDDLDRALVRARLDGRDVWIDPASDALGIPTMPAKDRHRHALVLGAATTALVDTPAISASENILHDARTYELARSGSARVTEVRRFDGVFGVYARTQRRDDPKGLEKELIGDAKSRLGIDAVDRMTFTDPSALDHPFEVTSVMTSPRGFTTRKHAEVWLYPNDVTWALPDALLKADEPARIHDYEWSAPQIYEIEHRIVVPDGYAMPAIADRTRDLGTMKLTETQRIAGNVLTVTFRLDTGKLRITAAEFAATRAALDGIAKEPVHLEFSNTAHQLYDKGAWKDAIAESNRLINAHPKDGKRHAAFAELLVMMGLGDAGRREAKLAVQLEPNDADNHAVLGWALAHDAFGRSYAPGHDHAGARAELEKARKLNPRHLGAAIELGNLLARDERGHPWGRGADPKACASARRVVYELEPSPVRATELATALLWAGDYAGAEKVARAEKSADDRDALLVTAIAAGSGTAAAIRAADGLGSGDARKRALSATGSLLMMMRRYAESRAVFTELGMFGPGTLEGQMLARIASIDHPLDIKTPAGAVIEAELAIIREDKPQGFWDAKTADELSWEIQRTMRATIKTASLSHEVYGDIARTAPTTKVEGDKRAWRVELAAGGRAEVLYAAEDRGAIKLIGIPAAARGAGRHALRLLAKNDVEAATRLLDWVTKDAKRLPLFEMVWGPNHGTDREAVALAAAVLSGSTDPDHALPIVEKCSAAPPKADIACLVLVEEINNARGAYDDTIAQMTARLATHPKEPAASRILAEAYALAGRPKEAEALLPDITAPFDRDLDLIRRQIALAQNDVPAAIKLLEAASQATGATHYPFNELAWLEVTTSTNMSGALTAASEAVRLDANVATLHTKAVVEAELGDFSAAIEDDHKAIELRLRDEPNGNDWYVLGRVAELIGLRDDAIAAYRQVKPGPVQLSQVVTSAMLAQRRLTALGKP